MRTLVPSLALSTVAILAFGTPASAQGVVSEGDTPSFQFGEETYNTMGSTGAANFAGKPVLVEFWGTH